MTGERKNRRFSEQHRSGLLRLRIFAKIYWRKLNKSTGIRAGEKHGCTIWFATVKTGVSLVSEHGECQFRSFTAEAAHRLLQMRPSSMYLNYLLSMVPTSGLRGTQRIYCLKALLVNIVRMVYLGKRPMSWMSASTQAQLTQLCLSDVMIIVVLLMFLSSEVISTAAGPTHHCQQRLQ